ncbi:MAG TPA: hypothetical protein VNL38_01315 [Candidatus Nitrosotenuis sp.]|nr:hypothetical protein [Candidatus Nitrosotenuis sp.]
MQAAPPKRANETSLARLRPGIDTMRTAEKRYPAKHRIPDHAEFPDNKTWYASCTGRTLDLELDAKRVIQSITVSMIRLPAIGDCQGDLLAFLRQREWITGKGLALGHACERAEALYGQPNSRGPSVQGKRELELLYYSFDWAGPDVPQVMEVTCDRESRRVVQITLAYPSL